MIIYKDTIFQLTSGEYDDYRVRNICKALQDINKNELLDKYFDEDENRNKNNFNRYDFDQWLLKNKYCEEITYDEWFTDLYCVVQYNE